ncbi:UvrD-helicase domain-containing protein [Conexibacter sp. SYSU D00693]|uniref:UvrD-helicase domain-containing protein n=1 Tax=Conexibacter sp. SYSU D00693 TaxID=2812560 RepID=UPI00196B025E|nr:UvrD-helicase domain-containing protein [Conexibacter sp. SYSU D00693]
MRAPQAFDVCGALPTGVTVLEASAGTGKTYTIAALATRYVAGGARLDELLLVTFTRMATGELRERVRDRLTQAERALTAALDAGTDPADRVDRLLADGTRDEVATRRDRLGRALADFDAATISTTHGFCLEALSTLGVVGDIERGATVTEDATDLLDDVVDDLYVRRFHHERDKPPFDRAQAGEIARAVVLNPQAPILPEDREAARWPPAMRARLAEVVRLELDARKRRLGVITYDDLLVRLDGTLQAPDGGAAAIARLRERYRIVLVDEFQDTDPLQWRIVEAAFGSAPPEQDAAEGRALVLIGDPKQAIYAFRGADVHAYLAAAHAAVDQATLRENWRSDQDFISALDALFDGARLGHDEIVHRQVQAAEPNRGRRLHGAPVQAPLRVRVVHRRDPSIGTTKQGYAQLNPAREHVAQDVAADVVALLSSGAQVEGRPVRPGDVAVLVRTHRQATLVHDALSRADVPVVINGAGSVFATAPAAEWLTLLEALERPTSPPRAHTAARTCFIGWSARQVAEADDDAWETVHRRLHAWGRVLRTKGVASLLEVLTTGERLPARVLRERDGERRLTDLRHVAQLLHAAATAERLGTTALATWLRARIRAAAAESGDEERSRRLESDAEAVQVLTIHRSKGLEFPIVHAPYLWDPIGKPRGVQPIAFHHPRLGERAIDVGLEGELYDDHLRIATEEERGEDLRLAYVALTRARHQAVLWWAGSWSSRHSALSRLVFQRGERGHVAAETDVPGDDEAAARFGALAQRAPGCIEVERSELPVGRPRWAAPAEAARELAAATFDRPIDLRWRRTSYSGIVAGAHEARVASEPEVGLLDDEAETDGLPAGGAAEPAQVAALRELPVGLDAQPSGVHFGTLVHRVLELADFDAPDAEAELRTHVDAQLARRPLDVDAPGLARDLAAVLETPLGGAFDDVRLRDVARRDRLDELDFELPLAGGDTARGRVLLDAVAAVLAAHTPAGAPLHGYAGQLADERLARELRGYLTGSIDLVLRLPGERFVVVDHKTNRLAAPAEPLTAWHYRPGALDAAMQEAHYGLQATLYSVALHRYLRWRLRGYDPDRHLGGVAYLFLRGMTGAATPTVDGARVGVFAWTPPPTMVAQLSDVLDRGGAVA